MTLSLRRRVFSAFSSRLTRFVSAVSVVSALLILSSSVSLSAWAIDDEQGLSLKPPATTPADEVRLYDEVWKLINSRFVDAKKNGQDWLIWRHRYDETIKTPDDTTVAIRSMLSSLNDPYTRYLDTEEFAEEGRSIKALLYGIGIQIGAQNDRVVVISPIEDTPAEKAGLKAGDVILEIDGKSTQGMSVKDAANLIRGQKGTAVKLLVQQTPKKGPKNYSILRDEIKLKSVTDKPPLDLDSRVGYIRLSSFLSENASEEFERALNAQKDKSGYIVDLRSNPGGLLRNAINIADMFLDKGGIVSTVDRDGYKETLESLPGVTSNKPLVLLINEGSASASEILAGALRDNNRAVLVGKKSFGKGLVQEINSLPYGAGVNITTQKYLTPNDTDINKVGILPDIEVSPPELKDDEAYDAKKHGDPQLVAAQAAVLDLMSGKSLNYLQNRSLVQSQTPEKDKAAATDEKRGLESIKAPVKVR
jgi:carboxyl-terminal processing protease